MKKNIFLWVSLIVNVFFLAMAGFYFFTPRMCRFIEATQLDMNFPLCNGKNSVKIVAPKEGDRWQQGQTYSISWNEGAAKVDLFLHDVAIKAQGESVSIVDRIYGVQNSGNYEYQVPSEMEPGLYTWCISSNEDYVCSGQFSVVPASSFVIYPSSFSLEDISQAVDTFRQFFDLLSTARYESAVSLYGGDYEVLRSWNPTVDPQNFVELWENGCTINGLQCMEVNNVKVIGMEPDLDNYFQFTVEFYNDDRGIYSDPISGNTKFTYTVQKGDNGFVVMQMPPYVE